MTRAFDRRERQLAAAPHLPHDAPSDVPRPERLRGERGPAAPLERARPALVPDPVADPVELADVDQRAHAALEQRGDVVLRLVRGVQVRVEGGADGGRARGEVACDGRVDAEEVVRGGLREVVRDVSVGCGSAACRRKGKEDVTW